MNDHTDQRAPQVPEGDRYFDMSLRDYFAAAALTGICVSDKFLRDKDMNEGQALWAYEIADAMLAARKAKP